MTPVNFREQQPSSASDNREGQLDPDLLDYHRDLIAELEHLTRSQGFDCVADALSEALRRADALKPTRDHE